MVRGRTTAPAGLVLGHEITGEVVEVGRDVEYLRVGDLVSVPFNVACGRCDNCKRGQTGVCLNVNPARAGGAYGYVDMGGWQGGQAEYAMIPYADFNCLKLPEGAMDKILDLATLSDIFPTGFHGAVTAGVGPGSTVYVAGAGPVGLAAAASAQLLGAAVVIVGDINPARLKAVEDMGAVPLDVSSGEPMPAALARILGGGQTEVDAGVDCVGFEARGAGSSASKEVPAQVLNDLMGAVRAGGALGVPGLYVTDDPGGVDAAAKVGALSLRLGLGWAKSQSIAMGQCPVMKYNKQLMRAIMYDRVKIAKAVGATVISLDESVAAYKAFDAGAPRKYILDPHGVVRKHHPNAPKL